MVKFTIISLGWFKNSIFPLLIMKKKKHSYILEKINHKWGKWKQEGYIGNKSFILWPFMSYINKRFIFTGQWVWYVARKLKRLEVMAPSKTLTHFFQMQPSKRLKVSTAKSELSLPSDLTPFEKSRIEFNKSLAKAKRNLKICTQRIATSKSKCVSLVSLQMLGLKLTHHILNELVRWRCWEC